MKHISRLISARPTDDNKADKCIRRDTFGFAASRDFYVMLQWLCLEKDRKREIIYFKRARMCNGQWSRRSWTYIYMDTVVSQRSVGIYYLSYTYRIYECICVYSCGGELSDETVRELGGEGQWMWPVYRIVVGTHSTRWQSDEYAGARPPLCRHSHAHAHKYIHVYTTHRLVAPATVWEQSVYVTRPLCRYTGWWSDSDQ